MNEDITDRLVRVSTAALVYRNDKELLLMRRKGSHAEGTWSLPGGKNEYGEDPLESAIRELREETGINAKSGSYVGYTTYREEKHGVPTQWVTLFFEVGMWSGNPEIKEPHRCDAMEWFNVNNLPEPLFEAFEKFVKKL